jgi:hypothetical protein
MYTSKNTGITPHSRRSDKLRTDRAVVFISSAGSSPPRGARISARHARYRAHIDGGRGSSLAMRSVGSSYSPGVNTRSKLTVGDSSSGGVT